MLTELSDLQESDEQIWGASKVSFTIETRSEEDRQIIQREYTFSHTPAWDKWMFQEFDEKKTSDTNRVSDRNWRRSRHMFWDESQSPTVSVPQEVQEQLEELLDVDELTLQTPGRLE